MANDLTNKSAAALRLPVSLPKLAPEVAEAVSRTTSHPRFLTDAQRDADANAQAQWLESWAPPSEISDQLIERAKRDLEAWEIFMRPCPIGPIEKVGTRGHWLMQLSMLCASPKGSMQEYMEKTAAYADGLQYPAACFTSAVLYKAARKFKFVPTFMELADFMDGEVAGYRRIYDRLSALAKMKAFVALPAPPREETIRRYDDMTPAEQRRHDETMKGLRARLAEAGVGESLAAKRARQRIDETTERQRALLAPIIEEKRRALLGEP